MVVIRHNTGRRRPLGLGLSIVGVLGAVVVLLLIVNGGLWLLRQLDRPASAAEGAVLYASVFDSPSEVWTQEPGQSSTTVADGQLQIAIDERNSIFSVLPYRYADFQAQANVTLTQANSDYAVIALLFRLQDKANYYVVKLRGDGAYRVERYWRGELEVISEWQISPLIRVGNGAINQLQVRAVGATISVAVNGQALPLCLKGSDRRSTWQGLTSGTCLSNGGKLDPSFSDSSFAFGKIALGADADLPGLRVNFDNVLILGAQVPAP